MFEGSGAVEVIKKDYSKKIKNYWGGEMVEKIDERHRIYHTEIAAPLWFKNRDFYIQSYVKYIPNLKREELNL